MHNQSNIEYRLLIQGENHILLPLILLSDILNLNKNLLVPYALTMRLLFFIDINMKLCVLFIVLIIINKINNYFHLRK